ncbi:MAG: GNAT family N-acetyltransferase [Polaribacter sp.]|jgi:ribosomal protein S18 acetylase RimI-like enzyme|nr:GNAT family N-acetyltransferase [Polaribacter sp.]MDG1953577.1 GNAT family N-acetyltransferase [Polaribacter sp.]MDG2074376.1 GNAT family N-acetyltransferase [Polaribacter sp.]
MQIRIANISDAEIISSLMITTFDENFGHLFEDRQILLDYFDMFFSVEKIKDGLQKDNNVFWLAFVNEKPVGYAKLKLHSPSDFVDAKKVSQLQKIYVLKEFLSMKIGHQLQDVLLQRAAKHGSEQIWLSVFVENERAVNFYLPNDFVEVGKHEFQIGIYNFDFIAMRKKLQN